jgi:hypothetical protein
LRSGEVMAVSLMKYGLHQQHDNNGLCRCMVSLGQYGKNQSNTDIFRIGPTPVSPITTRSESARHFDNCKKNSREILDW